VPHIEIPLEDEHGLAADTYENSMLYKTLAALEPDVLLVDLAWYMCHHFLNRLPGRKILLCRQVADRFFRIPLASGPLQFDPGQYDRVLAIEPFRSSIPMESINPVIIRNRDEILSRHDALDRLDVSPERPLCLFAFNGRADEFDRVRKTYSYLEDTDYHVIYSTNHRQGLFPAVDYFNAFDLVLSAAGYNAFWEAIYFGKETIFVPQTRRFEDQRRRVEECQEIRFDENGADQLVKMIMGL